MKPKHQRLVLLGAALAVLAGAGALAISALGETDSIMISPKQIALGLVVTPCWDVRDAERMDG